MTEREAWLWLAFFWEFPHRDNHNDDMWAVSDDDLGICDLLGDFCREGLISSGLKKHMRNKVAKLPVAELPNDIGVEAYKWGFTREDARLREQFCREQAALCEKEEQNAP